MKLECNIVVWTNEVIFAIYDSEWFPVLDCWFSTSLHRIRVRYYTGNSVWICSGYVGQKNLSPKVTPFSA